LVSGFKKLGTGKILNFWLDYVSVNQKNYKRHETNMNNIFPGIISHYKTYKNSQKLITWSHDSSFSEPWVSLFHKICISGPTG
jgi:hypothetical protein